MMARTKATTGGEIGVNGYFYKGGQFLPSTHAEPGRWKVGGKWVTTGRDLIAPGEFAVQPTPFSRSLFRLAGVGYSTVLRDDGKLAINLGTDGQGVRGHDGVTLTRDTMIRPGVEGVLGKEEISLGAIIDAWNGGLRWFDVRPDAVTRTA